MRTVLFILLVVFIQITRVLCDSGFGSVFPIPLTVSNDDTHFQHCPMESGAYSHTTNCSLFHMCTFGVLTTYSCIDGLFFNPTSGKCQYWPVEKEVKCVNILKQMLDTDLFPLAEPVKNFDYYHRRKSEISKCTQAGIYPDVLDCSLFHYCYQNKQHQLFKCPNGLHFDPTIFMCSAPQLVNCQYEPPMESTTTANEIDTTSTVAQSFSDTTCRDYASGTYLPVANKYDEFIMCENNGKSILMKCKLGFVYNALTTACENKPCVINSALCKNRGQCVDQATDKKGFQCICSIEYQGEYCDKHIELEETTKSNKETSTQNLLRLVYRLNINKKPLTTTSKTKEIIDLPKKAIFYDRPKTEDKIIITENLPTNNSPLSRIVHHLNTNSELQQQQQQLDQTVRMIFFIIFALISFILLASVIYGTVVCLRLILTAPIETVGRWNILPEESKV